MSSDIYLDGLKCLEMEREEMDMDMNMNMMEAEAPNNERVVRDLLSLARQLINEGKPLHALQAVISSLLFSSIATHLCFIHLFISLFIYLFILRSYNWVILADSCLIFRCLA